MYVDIMHPYSPGLCSPVAQFVDRLGLQYRNARQRNKVLDDELPPRPDFKRHTYTIGGETLEMYCRDSLDVLRDLYSRPEFASSMVYAPEKLFTIFNTVTGEVLERTFSDMHTGRWWWRKQVCLPWIVFLHSLITS